jgi:hypothetical protein
VSLFAIPMMLIAIVMNVLYASGMSVILISLGIIVPVKEMFKVPVWKSDVWDSPRDKNK